MAEVVTVKVNASHVDLKLAALPNEVRAAVTETALTLVGELADLARERAETLLAVRTGRFVASIKEGLRQGENSVTARVFSYAKTANLFEWGGKTGAHEILPDKVKALALPGGKFAARVQHPGGNYERRSIIHGAFAQLKPEIVSELEAAANEAAARASE